MQLTSFWPVLCVAASLSVCPQEGAQNAPPQEEVLTRALPVLPTTPSLGGDYGGCSQGLDSKGKAKCVKKALKKTWKAAQKKGQRVFLEFWSGKEAITNQWRACGYEVLSFDTLTNPAFDLVDEKVQAVVMRYLRRGRISAVFQGTPCSSWSTARHGRPPPLRDRKEGIYGLPNLSKADAERVRLGNATMKATAKIIRACEEAKVPVMLENPINSMLWAAPEVMACREAPSYLQNHGDYCQHGAKWRKRTRFATWCVPFKIEALCKLCKGKKGFCSRSGKKHVLLNFKPGEKFKVFRTRKADKYPKSVAKAAAKALADAATA